MPRRLSLVFCLVTLCGVSASQAQISISANFGTLSTLLFEEVSPGTSYTFKVAPTNATTTTVQGVLFDVLTNTGNPAVAATGPGYSISGFNSNAGPGPLGRFNYRGNAPAGSQFTFTATGLTIGSQYEMVFYNASWNAGEGSRSMNISMTGAQTNYGYNGYDEDYGGNSNGTGDYHTVSIAYTAAATDVTVVFTSNNNNSGYHFYGATNEVVIPEPSSLALATAALVAALAVLRRRRSA